MADTSIRRRAYPLWIAVIVGSIAPDVPQGIAILLGRKEELWSFHVAAHSPVLIGIFLALGIGLIAALVLRRK